jgi:hypothetical protein
MQIPKYKCPRCSTRTCSLACSKLHKERAQCSGVRDPAAFIKKSQLATPAGFDHDFNFLSKLERGMQKDKNDDAGRLSQALEQDDAADRVRREKRGEQFRRKVREMGVTVHQAPRGMLRERENQSRLGRKLVLMLIIANFLQANKSGRSHELIWSIGWLTEDGSRHVTTAPHQIPLGTAFRSAAGPLNLSISQAVGKKRKREVDSNSQKHRQGLIQKVDDGSEIADTDKDKLEPEAPQDETLQTAMIEEATVDATPKEDHTIMPGDIPIVQSEESRAEPEVQDTSENPNSEEIPQYFFYLVKIRTSVPREVLVPVDKTQSIGDILRGQAVLEFPSIRVLTHAPDSLPEKFLLERGWKADNARREAELRELASSTDVMFEETPSANMLPPGRIPNGADLLAILQQDIVG